MDKKELEEIVKENTRWRLEKQELDRRRNWIYARCIAIGLVLGTQAKELAFWAYQNFPYLKAGVEAFHKARGDI